MKRFSLNRELNFLSCEVNIIIEKLKSKLVESNGNFSILRLLMKRKYSKRLISKLTKKVKKEESDEKVSRKKEMGFSSLQNVTIDKIPSKLGRFVVANFNEQTYILSLDSGDKIESIPRLVNTDIDWRSLIYDYLQYSKLPLGTNHYLGPLTFLVLLYLDSTKFDRFPVVRTRPSIKNWSSYLMKQRQELEL
ncbi:hypothetical protein Tco_0504933, partial [Tanacetum coccineum]